MTTSSTDKFPTIEQRIVVPFHYPVHFTRGLFRGDNSLLDRFFSPWVTDGRPVKVLAVIDSGVAEHWPAMASMMNAAARLSKAWTLVSPPLICSGGEQSKNDPELLQHLYGHIQDLAIDRHCCVMVLGGGALIDAVGYVAATAHRGIRLLRLPTTVLAQNDAGIGVKNSVNALGSKNFLGTFSPPAGVINDFDFLRTLPVRERCAGMAEAIKVALVKDPSFFTWLVAHAAELAQGKEAQLEHLVYETAKLHLAHIAQGGDPFESGSARPLDFGHWAAHKLEALTEHRLQHGEAVAIGIALDTRYAVATKMLAPEIGDAVLALIRRLGLPTYDLALEKTDSHGRPLFISGLEEFRQHLGGNLCITLLRGVGEGVQVNQMDTEQILAARDWLKTQSSP